MRLIISKMISNEIGLSIREVDNMLEVPPKDEMGDFAFPCFSLAKKLEHLGYPLPKNKNPLIVAEDLAKKFRKKLPKGISEVDFNSGYVNFFIDENFLVKSVFEEVFKKDFGENKNGQNKKIVIDMSSPNIAKPFGIGHLRSTIIGNSIGKICESNGYSVIKINYLGDWGTQFGKIIFGFKKWGDVDKLKKNPSKHLLGLYIRANDKKFEQDVRKEFKKLEEGDKENILLWKKFKKLSLKEFESIYNFMGISFDVVSGESDYNDKMNIVVEDLRKKKFLKKDDGAEIVDLSEENLGVSLIQKSDGTSLYVTRDLTAAIFRKKEYNFHKMIYEVGTEQKLHFKQVFKILEKLGYSWSKDCIHVAHGLYLDKDGKKFSTRKGKTIFMGDILVDVIGKARENLMKKEKLPKAELDKRSNLIALAAIYYGDLKNSLENNVVFDLDKFTSFEGDTGPYLLYSYARANSILKRRGKGYRDFSLDKIFKFKNSEIKLLKKIGSFPEVVEKSYEKLAPNLIANYSFELSQTFNEFYHSCKVIDSNVEDFRLNLVHAFKITLKKSLELLGIKTLKEM
jgi:arginyl-tRNA synthetase